MVKREVWKYEASISFKQESFMNLLLKFPNHSDHLNRDLCILAHDAKLSEPELLFLWISNRQVRLKQFRNTQDLHSCHGIVYMEDGALKL